MLVGKVGFVPNENLFSKKSQKTQNYLLFGGFATKDLPVLHSCFEQLVKRLSFALLASKLQRIQLLVNCMSS